ncbi:HNH endonuclease signature motif containing protein [Streptomyces sp. NPDC000348]|uniref:HNH endonuclease signature motif containing protein n=1 Tax=Streptomyces sp. NPDC000348 TaxID=3364538 RepID=UPI00369F28DB
MAGRRGPEVTGRIKRLLWRLALGMCQMCRQELDPGVQGPNPTVQIAHIVALSDRGPRAEPEMPFDQRNAAENLLQLCPNCHDLIDKDETKFDIDTLRQIKASQETWAAGMRQAGKSWQARFRTVDYVNLSRIPLLPGGHAIYDAATRVGLDGHQGFHSQGMRVGVFLAQVQALFESWHAKAWPIGELGEDGFKRETLVSFNHPMRGRNTPTLPPQPLTGIPNRDPYLHCKRDGRTFRIRFDPAWLTTATATSDLYLSRHSPVTYAGLGRVVQVAEEEVWISALLFGQPKTRVDEEWDIAVANHSSIREELTWYGDQDMPF